MGSRVLLALMIVLGAAAISTACGSDDEASFPKHKDAGTDAKLDAKIDASGGKGGTGGTGGKGGTGGTSATGGVAGNGGTAGSAGVAGSTGGIAGAAGTAGSAGSGGSAASDASADASDASIDASDASIDASDAAADTGSDAEAGTACTQPSQCPPTGNECVVATCVNNLCGTQNAADGSAVAAQTAGDCKVVQCNGNGGTKQVNDNSDVPNDSNACTSDACNNGVPSNDPVASGTPCGTNGVCNAFGLCVGCNAPSDCPGSDTECKTRTCVNNVCGVNFAPSGTATTGQAAGDCQKNQCDGAGNITSVADNTDVPADDGNQCTSDLCSAGVPVHPNQPVDTVCNQNGGSVCSATGQCVQCNAALQCGASTACKTFTCNANTCGSSNTAAGTPTSNQTAGDCHQNQCDGNGGITNAIDNTDLPADDGNQCTGEICTAGTPSHPPLAINTACNQNGGSVCNGTGACVQCNAASQCGTSTECKSFTCTANTCGSSNTAAGTPTTNQTPGDCHQNQCDGNGGITNAIDNSDVPADDGNQCTGEICTAGAPSHPNLAINTACNQNGGTFCNGAGACVQCNAASQCGTSTECKTFTCSANTCGSNNTAAGTPTSTQTAGDCHENECDGNGGVVNALNNADVPIDGNQCTDDVCTAGAPSNPPFPLGTSCNQNGGSICNGTGGCVAPTCNDTIKDGTETDTDCGGLVCPPCVAGKTCILSTDCGSHVCTGGICQADSCTDTVQNGLETDVDCGGGLCLGCGFLKNCIQNTDCLGGLCSGGVCQATCSDGLKDGVETDTDCGGGVCSPCASGKGCLQNTDCQSSVCTGGTCA